MSSPAPNFLKVEGHDSLYRDPVTGAILNRDKSGYEAYMESQKLARARDEELNTLKTEMQEIKSLLIQLLNKDK